MRFFSPKKSEADLDAELRAYLELLTDENLRAGMTPDSCAASSARRRWTVLSWRH